MAPQFSQIHNQGNGTPFLAQHADTVSARDTVASYFSYLEDSLNPPLRDTVFRFELREIVLPEIVTDTLSSGPAYTTTSVFASPQNRPALSPDPIPRIMPGYDWLTVLLLVCVAILAWIRFYNTRRLRQIFRAVYARHHVNQLLRDGNLINERIALGLGFIFITGVSTIVVKFAGSSIGGMLGIQSLFVVFFILAAALSLLWLLKLWGIKALGSLFKTKQVSEEYLLSNVLFNITTGLTAFPFIIAWHFSQLNLLIYIILGIFILLAAMKTLRNISLGLTVQSFSIVYLFLYLCTLEILPFLFVYKYYTILDW